MKQIKLYSKKDISIWKSSNIKCLYVEIKNNIPKFGTTNNSCFLSREESIKQMIIDTLNKYKINDVELLINLMDNPFNHPFFPGFSSTTNCNIITIPNFSFYNWDYPKSDSFNTIKKEILDNVIDWENKEDKRMWSGLNANIIREKFYNMVKNSELYEFNLIESYFNNNKFYKLSDHTKYKYLLDFEGTGYSGRFPYLALTGSCVILLENTDPDRDFKLYYSDDFIENIHYLKIRYTNEDSIEKIINNIETKIKEHDCKQIGLNSKELATTLFTMDNILLYMSKVLHHYSEHYQDSDIILNSDIIYNKETLTKTSKIKLINHHYSKSSK
jgi:hypothetical protein